MTLEEARIKEGNFAYLKNTRKIIDTVDYRVTDVLASKISEENSMNNYDVFVILSPVKKSEKQFLHMQVNEFLAKS